MSFIKIQVETKPKRVVLGLLFLLILMLVIKPVNASQSIDSSSNQYPKINEIEYDGASTKYNTTITKIPIYQNTSTSQIPSNTPIYTQLATDGFGHVTTEKYYLKVSTIITPYVTQTIKVPTIDYFGFLYALISQSIGLWQALVPHFINIIEGAIGAIIGEKILEHNYLKRCVRARMFAIL